MISKYIVFEDNCGLEVPVIFPERLSHKDFAARFPTWKPISAGVVGGWFESGHTSGISLTLGISSRKTDFALIEKHFGKDL